MVIVGHLWPRTEESHPAHPSRESRDPVSVCDCTPITDEGARSSDHRPLSFARDSPHGWPEATVTCPGRSTLELWRLIKRQFRPAAGSGTRGVQIICIRIERSRWRRKRKRRRSSFRDSAISWSVFRSASGYPAHHRHRGNDQGEASDERKNCTFANRRFSSYHVFHRDAPIS